MWTDRVAGDVDADAAAVVSDAADALEGEREPNPVAQIVAVRTLQVTAATIPLLLLAQAVVGRERMRRDRVWDASRLLTAAGLSAYFVATFHPRTPFPGARLLTRLPDEDSLGERGGPIDAPSSKPAVALTFDDGPFAETTPRLLDALAKGNARATFFLVGERAAAQPELTRRIADEGHAIGVHGSKHRTMVLMNAREVASELREAQARIEAASGRPLIAKWLRPPYGFKSRTLMRVAGDEGWAVVAWSFDGRDYDASMTPESLEARVRERLRPRDIVLLHERPPRRRNIALDALPGILRHGEKKGWRYRTLNEFDGVSSFSS